MAGSITLDPTSLSFSSVAVGSLSTLTVNIKALGFGPFSVTSVSNTDTAEFASNIGGTLNTGDNNFSVSFTPASTGSKSDSFAIMILDASTTDTTEYDLPVDGTGTAAPPAAVSGFVTIVSQ
jgi:hypothetical protein